MAEINASGYTWYDPNNEIPEIADADTALVIPHPRTSDIRGYGKSVDTDQAEADEYRNG